MVRGKASARCVGSWARDAAKKSWPEVRPFDAPREAPRKKFRRAEAAREGTEASGTRRGSYLRQFRR